MAELNALEREEWDIYLEATRGKSGESYEKVESWAWARLRAARRVIRRRRRKLTA